MSGGLVRCDLSGPTSDEGDAVSSFLRVAFAILPNTIGEVTHLSGIDFGGLVFFKNISGFAGEVENGAIGAAKVFRATAVVAGEDNKGVLADFELIKGVENSADMMI